MVIVDLNKEGIELSIEELKERLEDAETPLSVCDRIRKDLLKQLESTAGVKSYEKYSLEEITAEIERETQLQTRLTDDIRTLKQQEAGLKIIRLKEWTPKPCNVCGDSEPLFTLYGLGKKNLIKICAKCSDAWLSTCPRT